MDRPNILYIHSHDTGRWIQPYGHPVPTPNLQRLAEEGVVFRQCFCANPTCSASRAALLTGQYPHQNGMLGLAHRGFSLNDYNRHLLHTLRTVGFHSALSGVQHIARGDAVDRIGYDEILAGGGGAGTGEAHLRASTWLDGNPPEPFFLSVGFLETHRAFPEPGPAEDVRTTAPPAPMPDTPETRGDMAAYKAGARTLDEKMGLVFDALRRNSLMERTLVVCTTDHGIAFPRMKCNLTDGGIGVLLIVRGPGGFTGGQVVDALVSHVDLYPTICEAAGADRPDWLEGVRLQPLVTGEAESVREEIHAEVNYHACYEPQRCVRTPRYKYIKRFDDRDKPVLPNCDAGPSKGAWLAAGWTRRDPPNEALYDCVFDPNEVDNRADDPACADVMSDMRARLQRWMEATDDPLLAGRVPAPPDAVLNDPDGLHPSEDDKKTAAEWGYA